MFAATTELYTLSLHDALPILTGQSLLSGAFSGRQVVCGIAGSAAAAAPSHRSEEHTSALQSLTTLVCRPLPDQNSVIKGRPSPRLLRRALASLALRRRQLEQA